MTQTSSLFLHTISNLLTEGHVVLYNNVFDNTDKEKDEVSTYLQELYKKAQLNHPYKSPSYDIKAGIWAAELIYNALQLILFRNHKESDLEKYISDFVGEFTPSSILSVDLCFQYLPDILKQLTMLHPNDPLVEVLERQLHIWHFSGIAYPTDPEKCNLDQIKSDPCLLQLYVDRVVKYKHVKIAKVPFINQHLKSCFGEYATDFWEDFNTVEKL